MMHLPNFTEIFPSASERKRQIDNELQNIEAPKAQKPK
jgi:hypothetical protein